MKQSANQHESYQNTVALVHVGVAAAHISPITVNSQAVSSASTDDPKISDLAQNENHKMVRKNSMGEMIELEVHILKIDWWELYGEEFLNGPWKRSSAGRE